MIEPLFGSGPSMWTTLPSAGFPLQTPIAVGNRPFVSPVFGSPSIPGIVGGVSTGAQNIAGPAGVPVNAYGAWPTAPQGFFGPNFAGALPFAPGSLAPVAPPIGDAVGITAHGLLAAVAMRRGQPQGPVNDQEAEDFIYDALELLPGAADVEVRCEGGRITLTGSVPHRRLKRDVGEIAWAIPGVNDVQNNVTITSRRRARGQREEGTASGSTRKQA
jgi:hypothetical protein